MKAQYKPHTKLAEKWGIPPVPLPRRDDAGAWFINHYRTRQRDSGTLAVARQLRKQGVPLDVALEILKWKNNGNR